MFQDKYVFAQLISFLNRSKSNRVVAKYNGNNYVKHFTCWNQLLTLMFGQLSNRESLRYLIIALDAHHSKCYHLGVGRNVSRSPLARAIQDRNYHIFDRAYNNSKMLYKISCGILAHRKILLILTISYKFDLISKILVNIT